MQYEPTVVKIEGTLISKTFPGPPNYTSVKKGDRPETYWLIRVRQPICVDQDPREPDLGEAHQNVRLVQLVVKPDVYKLTLRWWESRFWPPARCFQE